MIDLKEPLSKRLTKSWTAHGVLIFRKQARCLEVEVPMLALDAEAVGRAITANLQHIKSPDYPEEALDPDITLEIHSKISKAWRHELTVATDDLTLAAALLARRGQWSPTKVTKKGLNYYAGIHLWRGGRVQGDPNLVEFLFILDGPSPTIYVSSDELAAVTRFVGAEFLSVRVNEDELRLRVEDAVTRLEKGDPPPPCSMMNMEDWLTREGFEGGSDKAPDDKDDFDEE